jgi:hypothetical protein
MGKFLRHRVSDRIKGRSPHKKNKNMLRPRVTLTLGPHRRIQSVSVASCTSVGYVRCLTTLLAELTNNTDLRASFAAAIPSADNPLKVLRSFFFTDAAQCGLYMTAAFQIADSNSNSDSNALVTIATEDDRAPDLFVETIDEERMSSWELAQRADERVVAVTLRYARGDRVLITIEEGDNGGDEDGGDDEEREDREDQRALHRSLTNLGMVLYNRDAMTQLLPRLVLGAVHGTPLWSAFVRAVMADGLDLARHIGIDDADLRMLIRLAGYETSPQPMIQTQTQTHATKRTTYSLSVEEEESQTSYIECNDEDHATNTSSLELCGDDQTHHCAESLLAALRYYYNLKTGIWTRPPWAHITVSAYRTCSAYRDLALVFRTPRTSGCTVVQFRDLVFDVDIGLHGARVWARALPRKRARMTDDSTCAADETKKKSP